MKADLESNPDFYKPLADKLEELIAERRANRLSQLELFEEFDKIQQKIIDKSKEAGALGFNSDQEFAVFNTLENKINGDAKGITNALFTAIEGELSIADWQHKNQVMKAMRVKIKGVLRDNVQPKEIQSLAVSLLELMKRN